jgi:hypothetical protein
MRQEYITEKRIREIYNPDAEKSVLQAQRETLHTC